MTVESRIHVLQVVQRAHEEAGADEEHQGERNLDDHQSAAETRTPAAAESPPAALELRIEIDARGAERGREPEEKGRPEGHGRREAEDARVEREVEDDGGVAERPQRQQQIAPPPGERHAEAAPATASRQRLGEQLSNDTSAARAQGQAERDFTTARGAAREQQVRDVRARSRQQQADETHQRAQGAGELTSRIVLAAGPRVGDERRQIWHPFVGGVACRPAGDPALARRLLECRLERGCRLRRRRAGREPAHDPNPPVEGCARPLAVRLKAQIVRERHRDVR